MLRAGALQKNFRRPAGDAPDFRRTGNAADRTAARGAFEELFRCDDRKERVFHEAFMILVHA